MKKELALAAVLIAALAAIAAPAMALDLSGARAAGSVCEKSDGYVKALTADASGVAADVNNGRQTEYQRISKQNGQSVEVVAKLASQQIIAQGHKACN